MTLLDFIYRVLKKFAMAAGYELAVTKFSKESGGYEPISPFANYAPWLSDSSFNNAYRLIKGYTKVDKYRCYELWQLVEETAKLHGAFIEVGVWRGGSGALIAEKAKLIGIRDSVYLCDTFKGVVKVGHYDPSYKGGEHADASREIVEDVVHKLELDNVKLLVGIFPDETGKFVTDDKFRFCHIDVDIYLSAKDIVEWLWPRLVIGGIIVFDDYGFSGCEGITRFVNEERNKKDRLVIYNLNGHAIMVKLPL